MLGRSRDDGAYTSGVCQSKVHRGRMDSSPAACERASGNLARRHRFNINENISIPMSIRFVVQKRRRMNPSFPPKPQPKGRSTVIIIQSPRISILRPPSSVSLERYSSTASYRRTPAAPGTRTHSSSAGRRTQTRARKSSCRPPPAWTRRRTPATRWRPPGRA